MTLYQELSVHAGYYDLLTYTGLHVLDAVRFGKNRGDLAFAVRSPAGHCGIVIVGYGSCEGCDVLRSVQPPPGATAWPERDLTFILSYAQDLAGSVNWGTRDELFTYFLEGEQSLLTWYGHETGFADAIARLLTVIPE